MDVPDLPGRRGTGGLFEAAGCEGGLSQEMSMLNILLVWDLPGIHDPDYKMKQIILINGKYL
jgi:hypothetical protein